MLISKLKVKPGMRIRVLLFHAVLLVVCDGCSRVPEDNVKYTQHFSDNPEGMIFEANSPRSTLEWFESEGDDGSTSTGGLNVKAVEDVRLQLTGVHEGAACVLDCELLTLLENMENVEAPDGQPFHRYFLSMNGEPCSLEDAILVARQLCHLFAISHTAIERWEETESFRDPLSTSVLQTGNYKSGSVSVTIRQSFNAERPWRVICTVGFD